MNLNNTAQDFQHFENVDELRNCTRCGFCQPTCPTFIQTGRNEASSPRGRIALIQAVVDGQLEPSERFERELSLCLGCRACESACPSGVQYGQILEEARAIMAKRKRYSWPVSMLRSFFFKTLIPHQRWLKGMGVMLWAYQRFGIQWVVRQSGLLSLLKKINKKWQPFLEMEAVMPRMPSPRTLWQSRRERKAHLHQNATNHTDHPEYDEQAPNPKHPEHVKHPVAFFTGCIMDVMFHETNERTLKLLKHRGGNPTVPQQQTCCGALHAHAGEFDKAQSLAKQNIAAFEQACHAIQDKDSLIPIITNAGGCGAFLQQYPHLLAHEPEWHDRAVRFAECIQDLSSWLVDQGTKTQKTQKNRAKLNLMTYQDSCHLRHGMNVHEAPRKLLKSVDENSYIELPQADHCCGSAGIYNLIESEMATHILADKMEQVNATEAITIVTSNPGCLLQMKLGIRKFGRPDRHLQAVHIADVLYEDMIQKK
ncbi:(Fe-S)-binding protein [Caldalkalibacillus salinus]|uniref:(Fe-S)-binding protein n=1 Tax=Caldalkalibacillus salinus TaxID=2803787 RepID=UPI0019218080|nr:(Fe-S)-binding protein [Caldalkalibacillus salinus]